MSDDTIKRIREQVKNSEKISSEQKNKLNTLIKELEKEMQSLSEQDSDKAKTIAGFAEISAHEAIRETDNDELFDIAGKGLSSAVKDIEVSHPKLVSILNSISVMLSDMSI